MPVATAAIIGAAAVTAFASYMANKSAEERAAMINSQSMQQWLDLNIPDPEAQKLVLEQFVVQGKLDPKLEQAIKADPSEFEQIVTNHEDQQAQRRALSEMEKLGYEGGLGLQDKADLQSALMEGTVKDRGNRLAIEQDQARRGLAGSGFDVASQLQAQQSGADRDSQTGLNIAAQAQERALQAIMGAGNLATQYRTQDFGEQSAKASAADRINLFNTQNLQDVQQRNISSQNRAEEMNLANKQDVANKNTQLSNYEQEFNKGLLQQNFENQMSKVAGMTGQYQNQANQALRQGQQQSNLYSNLGNSAVGGIAAKSNQDYWDEYFKKQNKQKAIDGAGTSSPQSTYTPNKYSLGDWDLGKE